MAESHDVRLELDRIALAVEALIWILGEDPRVQRAFAAWVRRVFASALSFDDAHAVILLDVVTATVRQNRDDDLAALTRLVTDDLRLGVYAAWLPSYLLADFGQTLAGHMIGEPSGIRLTPDVPPDVPASRRRLKSDGAFVADYVRDYYRAEIQQAPIKPYAIAKERRDAQRAAGVHVAPRVDVTSVIEHITLAKQWLAAVVVEDAR
jgi:hypothetical protein